MRRMSDDRDLEARAQAGSAQAQYELGLKMLSVDRADADGLRGIALVEAAADADLADAMARIALFEAMGVGRPQNWSRAFDRLQGAAERGSPSAQAQLVLLSDWQTAAEPVPAPVSDWATLRASIDIDRALAVGERQILSETPRIRVVKGFATPAECAWLICRARERLRLAPVFDPATGKQTHDDTRNNSAVEFQVTDMDLVVELIRARIGRAINLPVPLFEPTQVLHYAVGQRFAPHHDFLDPANPGYRETLRFGQRIATFLLYLNEGFEGGATEFPTARVSFRGATGDALFFANVDRQGQPDPATLHAGVAPTSGEKWLLSQWIRDRAGQPQ